MCATPSPDELAQQFHDEMLNTAHAYIAAVDDGATPLTAAQLDWINMGIEAGYLTTMEMLVQRGALRSGA